MDRSVGNLPAKPRQDPYSRPVSSRTFAILLLMFAPVGCRRGDGTLGDGTISGTPARVSRFATRPVIDGRLDEAVWRGGAGGGAVVGTKEGGGGFAGPPPS